MQEQENMAEGRAAGDRHPPKRAIFRDDAVRRYVESREKSVFPPLLLPKTLFYLWLLLGLLAAGGVMVWFVLRSAILGP